MKKLFTLFAFLACFLGANAITIVDAEVDFSQYTDISQVPRFSWGGAQQAWDRLSIQDGCLHWSSSEVPLNDDGEPTSWLAQWFPIGGVDAEVGVIYTLHYKIKGDHAENISALGFGQTPYGQFPITTDWVEGTVDYECTEANGNILMQAGGYVGQFDIAYLKITHEGKEERPVQWTELIKNGDAETPWGELADVKFNDADNNTKVCFWSKEKGHNLNDNGGWDPFPAEIIQEADGNHAFICRAQTADTEGDASAWDNQIWIQSPRAWKAGEQFKLSFRYKASEPVVTNTQVHKQTPSDYLHWIGVGDVSFTTEWQTFEQTVSVSSDQSGMYSVAFNLSPNVKTPVDFYIDDISWCEMVLDHGLFVAGTNTETGLVDYDYDNAIELTYDEGESAYTATIGTAGNKDSWVNELMISTVRGNDRQFKANTIKAKGAILEGIDNWVDFEDGASAKIKLPAQGVWTVYVDTDASVMAFVEVEGDSPREPIEIVPNESEVTVHGLERDYTSAEAPEGYEFPKDDNGNDIQGYAWDNQFWVFANRTIAAGEEVTIEFDYFADKEEAKTTTQIHGLVNGNTQYLHWSAIGDVTFTKEEQHFAQTFTWPSEGAKTTVDAGEITNHGIAFNMAEIKEACNYTIKNVVFKTSDDTETLIDMEGTKNFYVKEGAGTAPYQYGTDPTAISTAVVANQNGVAYNIAGQRVSNNYKGIVVKNGSKFINK